MCNVYYGKLQEKEPRISILHTNTHYVICSRHIIICNLNTGEIDYLYYVRNI